MHRRLSGDWLQNRWILPWAKSNLRWRQETDFDTLAERGSNPVQRCQRMPFVIRVLQARDNRLLGSNAVGQCGLRKAGLVAASINELGDSRIDPRLLGE